MDAEKAVDHGNIPDGFQKKEIFLLNIPTGCHTHQSAGSRWGGNLTAWSVERAFVHNLFNKTKIPELRAVQSQNRP